MRQMMYVAGLLLATATPAWAQDVCSQYRPLPAVGSWAQYQTDRGGQTSSLRMAIVGQEKRDGKAGVWFETASESPRGKMIVELLVPSYPFEPETVMEAVMKRGDEPAVKMPGSRMGGGRPAGQGRGGRGGNTASAWEQQCKTMAVVGAETLTVPAGVFKTTHLHSASDSTDVWVTKDVPFGLVKSVTGRSTMTLQGMGKNAKKSITETPKEMPGMPGM